MDGFCFFFFCSLLLCVAHRLWFSICQEDRWFSASSTLPSDDSFPFFLVCVCLWKLRQIGVTNLINYKWLHFCCLASIWGIPIQRVSEVWSVCVGVCCGWVCCDSWGAEGNGYFFHGNGSQLSCWWGSLVQRVLGQRWDKCLDFWGCLLTQYH